MSTIRESMGVLAMLCASGATVAGPVSAQPAATTRSVDAIQTGDMTPVQVKLGGEPVRQRRTHPPIDQIPAMPMPHVLDMPPAQGMGIGSPVMYDLTTGVETVLPVRAGSRAESGEGGGFNGADLADSLDDLAGSRSFGTMINVDEGAFPWRMNAKLVMRFVDESGTVLFFVASGSMADAETVLTAGHVVYARTPSGFVINDWATDVWVYPGWDGIGSTDEFSGNWGEANSTSLASWTGWTQNGDFDRDVGLIRVNRAVGMLTGWFGWAWGGSCSSIMSETYNVGSYPAEGCGGGLHNGRDQYYWWGTYDSCPGQQLQTITTPGCLTAQWGGMSGGGSYYFTDGGTRVVHSIISNSNNATFANHVKQWESWVDFRNDFANDSRGGTFDIQALQARYSDSTPTAGQTISAEFDAPNPTNANPGSDSYTFRHYLSTNDFISASDTQIGGSWVYNFNYGAVSNAHINPHNITIPIGTPTGSYWLGVEMDPATDAFDSNDNTTGWDSFSVSVSGVADIVASSILAPSGTFNPGETFVIAYTATNQGGDPSNPVSIDVRASTNDIISTFDTQIGLFNFGGLSGGGVISQFGIVQLPPDLAPGTYYIGFIASASDDVDGTNNTTFDAIPITVAECVADFAPAYGVLDFDDVLAFLVAFGAQDSAADLSPAFGVWDFDDVLAFLTAFGAGCP